jgi:ribosome-binding factor A
MQVPKAFVHQREFADAVDRVGQKLGANIVRIRHSLDYDSTGDPAVYFRVVMPDSSLTRDKLLEATRHVSFLIEQELQPQEEWGVFPYFRFRSQSEQEAMQEPAWA